jgi:hypothetical protein
MTSLNLADNAIGGYYIGKGGIYENFRPTPEGVCTIALYVLRILPTFNRTNCYRCCHQDYEGVDEAYP